MSFLPLQSTDIVVSADTVVTPTWSDNQYILSAFYTGSSTNDINDFYVAVYQTSSLDESAEVQFNISYGNKVGSGSSFYNSLVPSQSPTKTIYGQYRTLIYGDENQDFNFGLDTDVTEFFAININRNRYKEHILPGSLTLVLKNTSLTNNCTLTLTDNSNQVSVNTYLDCGRVFDLVSGSAGVLSTSVVDNQPVGYMASGSYGLLLPDIGVIILNTQALQTTGSKGGLGITINRPSGVSSQNELTLLNGITSGSNFTLLSEETLSSNYIFVRLPNQEFNYSLNPSMISGSGELVYDNFIQNPQTYPTTIGLYNDNNELLAVAKLSKPTIKDFTREGLYRVKLNW